MSKKLEENIRHLKSLEGAKFEKYANALLWLAFEDKVDIPVMNPDLWDKLFPVVKQGYEEHKMPYVKWMYHAFGFKGVYAYLQCQPEDVLRQALAIEPKNDEVAGMLYREHLQLLDFALHELPLALCVGEKFCLEAIEEAKQLRMRFPRLSSVERRGGGTLEMYEQVLADWLAYEQNNRKGIFRDRREAT